MSDKVDPAIPKPPANTRSDGKDSTECESTEQDSTIIDPAIPKLPPQADHSNDTNA